MYQVQQQNKTFERTMSVKRAQRIPGVAELLSFEAEHGGLGNVAVVTFEKTADGEEFPVSVYTYLA